ncbi:hypothetical protein FKP32DRAFT_1222927 [Trametes sanguinea]|nr:hypothetical protein FKP32DRAFT_1222927 [Trametes sanguinea]
MLTRGAMLAGGAGGSFVKIALCKKTAAAIDFAGRRRGLGRVRRSSSWAMSGARWTAWYRCNRRAVAGQAQRALAGVFVASSRLRRGTSWELKCQAWQPAVSRVGVATRFEGGNERDSQERMREDEPPCRPGSRVLNRTQEEMAVNKTGPARLLAVGGGGRVGQWRALLAEDQELYHIRPDGGVGDGSTDARLW